MAIVGMSIGLKKGLRIFCCPRIWFDPGLARVDQREEEEENGEVGRVEGDQRGRMGCVVVTLLGWMLCWQKG